MIMRQGIPFGPELTEDEVKKNKTELDRGLAFTCYQSNLANGFEFVQESESIGFTLIPSTYELLFRLGKQYGLPHPEDCDAWVRSYQ